METHRLFPHIPKTFDQVSLTSFAQPMAARRSVRGQTPRQGRRRSRGTTGWHVGARSGRVGMIIKRKKAGTIVVVDYDEGAEEKDCGTVVLQTVVVREREDEDEDEEYQCINGQYERRL